MMSIGLFSSANAADSISSMFSEGKVSGQIREFSISREITVDNSHLYTRQANAIGGHLKYETASLNGLSAGVAFYTSNGFGLGSPKDDPAYRSVDPTLLGKDNANVAYIGEAYLQYKYENTTFKAGRQVLNTPMAGTDDARMLPNLFEAYVLTNTDLPDTTLVAAHVTKFAQGTFGRAYNAAAGTPDAVLSATSGYSAADSRDQATSFVNMGEYALGSAGNNDGVTVGAVIYSGIENLKVQLWDYYAYNILNAMYGQADYTVAALSNGVTPYVSAQFIKEDGVGNNYASALAGEVDSLYIAAKVGAKFGNANAYIAYSSTGSNSAAEAAATPLKNAIISPWGGMPAFTQGMVTRHQFMAGVDTWKVAGSYNFKDMGVNASATAYYTSFKMDGNSGYGVARTATEPGFDLQYYPEAVKNLQLRLRGNFPRNYKNATGAAKVGWNEYRFIVNYNF